MCTQGFLAFLSEAFFLLAPLWRRLGLLLTKDNLAFFRGSADCGDLPDTPFSGRSFKGCFLPAGATGDTGVAPFTWDSLRFFFSFGVLAGALGLVASGGGLLVAGVPLACAGPRAFRLFLLFLPVLGGWSPPETAALASSSGTAASGLCFLRFLVSGKNPFFFLFVLTGLCVTLGPSLASFFSDLGRLEESAQ